MTCGLEGFNALCEGAAGGAAEAVVQCSRQLCLGVVKLSLGLVFSLGFRV